MPTDEEIIQDAFYIRDLVHHSAETRELADAFFTLLRTEEALTAREMGDGFKLINVRNSDGEIVDREKVRFEPQDYDRMSGIIEGLSWLEPKIQDYIKKAGEYDKVKKREKEDKS